MSSTLSIDTLAIIPIDPDTMYVRVAPMVAPCRSPAPAAKLAAEKGLTDLAARAAGAAPDDVVAVAWMGAVATGEALTSVSLLRSPA